MPQQTIEADGHRIVVSRIDKELYPADGINKAAVVDYYSRVADVMVPHLRGRPLALRRFPDGIEADGFFQKEASDYFPDWIRRLAVPQRGSSGAVHHVLCDDAASLLYLSGQAVLEFHVFLSTMDNLDYPDLLVIDLDPPAGVDLGELRRTAREVRDVFAELGLVPCVQATGGRGYHVAAPLDGSVDFDSVRALARDVADLLVDRHPDRLTTAQRRDQRGDRIFLDTNRNAYGQTMICPYSLRARPHAPAATPLGWDELGRTAPNHFGHTDLPRRIAHKSDPWADLHRHTRSASIARDRLDGISA